MLDPTSCPCGSAQPYDACCGPLLRGEAQAPTAEALMRARYTAYARGEDDYVFRTWHPRTRPADVSTAEGPTWVRLELLDVHGGGPGDAAGVVEFGAHYHSGGAPGVLHERSRFERRAGRWFYVDGDVG